MKPKRIVVIKRTRYHVLGLDHKGWHWLTDSLGCVRKSSAMATWNKRKGAYSHGIIRKTTVIETDEFIKLK